MKDKKQESNIIIAISAMNKVIQLFLGPFLTAYFIKKSQESIVDLSIYNIISYIILGIGSFIIASVIKNKFRIGMFRIGVILNYIYILTIIVLREKIINHLWLIAILFGTSSSAYWFSYNLFAINKIDNKNRTDFTVKTKNISSIIGIIFPIILGSLITVTNYELTAVIVLIISAIQIMLSLMLSPDRETDLPRFNIKKTLKQLKHNKQVIKSYLVEFFIGMNIGDGALEILMTILVFNTFKTDMNLGIITSITTILSIIAIYIYGKVYKKKDDKKIVMASGILPIIALLLFLVIRTNITLVIFNVCYVVFTSILMITRQIRVLNISDSSIVSKSNQCEYSAIREGALNMGRITGYILLLIGGIINSKFALNIILIILTTSIPLTAVNISKMEKFEK